jgi:hypothetical protein
LHGGSSEPKFKYPLIKNRIYLHYLKTAWISFQASSQTMNTLGAAVPSAGTVTYIHTYTHTHTHTHSVYLYTFIMLYYTYTYTVNIYYVCISVNSQDHKMDSLITYCTA